MLTFLPRLTSWGSLHRARAGDPDQWQDSGYNLRPDNNLKKQLQDDLYSFKMSYEIPKKTKKKKKKRKSISYWSDEDAISIKTNRCVLTILNKKDSAIGICIAL